MPKYAQFATTDFCRSIFRLRLDTRRTPPRLVHARPPQAYLSSRRGRARWPSNRHFPPISNRRTSRYARSYRLVRLLPRPGPSWVRSARRCRRWHTIAAARLKSALFGVLARWPNTTTLKICARHSAGCVRGAGPSLPARAIHVTGHYLNYFLCPGGVVAPFGAVITSCISSFFI